MARTDSYLKIVLTVIALELLWIGLKDTAPAVSAQVQATPVIIKGVDMNLTGGLLPVVIAGSARDVPAQHRPVVEKLTVRVTEAVPVETRGSALRVEAARPFKIEADRPLKVENVGYEPGQRPGD
jgi:hypothetical protein